MGECFEQETVFPIIQAVIQHVCATKAINPNDTLTQYALHSEIAKAFLEDEYGRAEVRAAVQRCPQHSETWMADNMIQWWSQRSTARRNEWAAQFLRKKIGGNWTYKPISEEEMYRQTVPTSRRVWAALIDLAFVRRTITYKELGARLQIQGRALQNFDRTLAPIKHYCIQRTLPPLSALVVYTGTGLPGSEAEADELGIENVFAYDWKGRKPMIPSEDELADAMRRQK
jgi:hypothetical protein